MSERFPTPTKPGYYWGKWKIADDGPKAAEYRTYLPCYKWEPMDVFKNHSEPDEPDYLRVHIPGVEHSQSLENFFWGPELPAPPSE